MSHTPKSATFMGFQVVAYAVIALLVLPLAFLVVESFLLKPMGSAENQWTFHWYDVLMTKPEFIKSAGLSLVIATVSATIATMIATFAALVMTRGQYRWLEWVHTLTLVLSLIHI